MRSSIGMLLLALAGTLPLPALADGDAAQRGLQIAEEMTRRDKGFKSFRMNMEMVLRDRQGQSSVRQIRAAVLEVDGDGDKVVMMFETPADTRGTVFLSFAHADKADDQWLYLPSIKRTKRIASETRAGSFMGSEFAFEDMTAQELRKYDYKYLGDDKLAERSSAKLERIPRYEGSGYTRQVMWVDAERFIPLKIEFYDRRNELLKTLNFSGYKLHENKFWKAGTMAMENHQSGKSTVITLSNYQFRAGVSEQDFDPQRLEYAR